MRRRRFQLLILVAALVGTLAVARGWLIHEATSVIVAHRAAPSEASMDDVVAAAPAPAEGLVRIWAANKPPHRHYVMKYLSGHPQVCRQAWRAVQPMVRDAVASRDVDLQEPGMKILRSQDAAEASSTARGLVRDADPDVRALAVRVLAQTHEPRYVPDVLECVGDAERSVRAGALLALPQLTGHTIDLSIDAGDRDSYGAAAGVWRVWCKEQAIPLDATPIQTVEATSLMPAPDFSLRDMNGREVRLSDFRGKPVLLNFWATWCGPCMAELPALVRLQQKHGNQLTVLGINADAVPDDDGDGGNGADPTKAVAQAISQKGIGYPILIDRTGSVVNAYDGSGIPISVFVDAKGIMRRRLLGTRTLEAFERMLAEIQ